MEYKLKSPPSGKNYYNLLDFLGRVATEFLLVKKNESVDYDIFIDLSSNLIKTENSSEWPGTKSFSEAEIRYFKVTPDTVSILKSYSKGLFDWMMPNLPEDLAFFRSENSVILGSIAHEKDYWLILNDRELHLMELEFPVLKKQLTLTK